MSNFCSNCGTELGDLKFCPSCGASAENTQNSGNNTSAGANNTSPVILPHGKPRYNACDIIIMAASLIFIILSLLGWFSVTIPFDETYSIGIFSLNNFISAIDTGGDLSLIPNLIVIAVIISIVFSVVSFLKALKRKRAAKSFSIASMGALIAAIIALAAASTVKAMLIEELDSSGVGLLGEMLVNLFECTFAPKLMIALGLIGAFFAEYGIRLFSTELGDVPVIGSNLSMASTVESLSDSKGKTYKAAYCPTDTTGVYTATLNKRYVRFNCFAYVPANCSANGSATVTITADGKPLYTQEIAKDAQRVHINLNIKGCVHFEIKIINGSNLCYLGDPKFYQ